MEKHGSKCYKRSGGIVSPNISNMAGFSSTYIPAFSSLNFTIPFSYIYIYRVIFELSNRLIFFFSEELQISLKNRSNCNYNSIRISLKFSSRSFSRNISSLEYPLKKGRKRRQRDFSTKDRAFVSNTWPINDPPVVTLGR